MREIGEIDAKSKKIYESFIQYRKHAIQWAKIGEQGYINARLLPVKYI